MEGMDTTRKKHLLGQAGVLRASSELLLRGVETYFPSVDLGCDLRTLTAGIQVKSAHLTVQAEGRNYYFFLLDKGRERKAETQPDLHILWGVDEDRFWIVPSPFVAGKKMCATASLRENSRNSKFSQWENAWEPLAVKRECQHLFDGEAGNQRVTSEILRRGVPVSRPIVDLGADLVTGALRIQVKSARLSCHDSRWNQRVYGYNLNTHLGRKDAKEQRHIRYSDYLDLFVFFGIEQNRFWIIPAAELDGRDRIFLGNDSAWIDPAEIADLRSGGKSYQEIADEQGISVASAWRKVNQDEAGKFEDSARLRQFENRWDLITGPAETLAEAEAAASVTAPKAEV